MDTRGQKKIVVEYFLTPVPNDRPLVDKLIRGAGLTVNLRRARVTQRDAWLQLDVSGAADAVDTFVRRHRSEAGVVHRVSDIVA